MNIAGAAYLAYGVESLDVRRRPAYGTMRRTMASPPRQRF